MAEYKKSDFIDHQDKNGDGLNDKCDDLIAVTETLKCPPCQPNPNFVTPSWRKITENSSWFNEKFCKYQAAIVTTETTVIDGEDLHFESYADDAIEEMLLTSNKELNDESKEALKEVLEYQKYSLDPRLGSYLVLLYSVPIESIVVLEDAVDDSEEEDEEEEQSSGSVTVTMDADYISEKLIRFRKAMNLYSRLYRVYRAVDDQGSLIWTEGPNKGALWSPSSMDKYGDAGMFPKSVMGKVMVQLDSFLNGKGLNIFGVGSISFGRDRVTKLEFTWDSDYKLKKLKAFTVGCGNKPKVYVKNKSLKTLNRESAWKDPIAMAYFSQLDKIDSRLNAREAPTWSDFIVEFTKPAISESFNWPGPPGPEIERSCVGDALAEQGKQLGSDIMDDILGIGDVLAFKFNQNLCKKQLGLVTDEEVDFGTIIDPDTGESKNLGAMAATQAFKQMAEDDQMFLGICASMMSTFLPGKLDLNTTRLLDEIYAEGLDRIKMCGLWSLLMDSIECLMSGLSLEQALSRIISSCLKAMSIDNLGDFFLGLPPDKQAELEKLVDKKIQEGNVLKDPTGSPQGLGALSDQMSGKVKYSAPWKKKQSGGSDQSPTETNSTTGNPQTIAGMTTDEQSAPGKERRTLAQQFDVQGNASDELSPNIVLEAYVLALVEVYSDDLLSVVDMLNKYPGSQIIAKFILSMDCPRPPIFDPNFLDFIKSIDLPWCRSTKGIVLPKLQNPFGWIPKLKDITWFLWWAFLAAVQKAVMSILVRILIKTCELISSAICKALELTGSMAAALPAVLSGRNTLADVINEGLCGGSGDQKQIEDTIADLFEKLGAGAAALSDKDALMNLTQDISNFTTRAEQVDMYRGNASDEVQQGCWSIIQNEYPELAPAFPTPGSFTEFVGAVGALLPEELKENLDAFLEILPEDDAIPANPTLCATPELLEEFQELRCELLAGRASPEQCRAMLDDIQEEAQDDLGALMDFANNPMDPMSILPPLISSPGCDDGILPFESDEQKTAAFVGLGAGIEALKKDYSDDMLGNGGFLGWGTWGFINMIMADTLGNPLTTHHLKVARNRRMVDFITDTSDDNGDDSTWWGASIPAKTSKQLGNYPVKVAPWLQELLGSLEPDYSSNTNFKESWTKKHKLENMGVPSGKGLDTIGIPDMGWATYFTPTEVGGDDGVKITYAGRKKNSDIKLVFRDNNKGQKENEGTTWLYGFDLYVYSSEMAENPDGTTRHISDKPVPVSLDVIPPRGSDGVPPTLQPFVPLDTTRIKIKSKYKPGAASNSDMKKLMTKDEWKELKEELKDNDTQEVEDLLFEFLAVDESLKDIDVTEYPAFGECFKSSREYTPEVILLQEMIANKNSSTPPALSTVKGFHDAMISGLYANFAKEIADNDNAFLYGAQYDNLSKEDAEYVVDNGQTDSPGGTPYEDAEIDGEKLGSDDMILGISRDQYENGIKKARVIFLDPSTFGGSYRNPAVYIKPLKNAGWLGFIEALFPDYTPCKPHSTDLVDFGQIQQEISNTYNSIPEDQRLKSSELCATEIPYNRILERPGKANIQGLIRATCRIYSSVHAMKAMASFSTFKPDFKNVYSSVYSQYIVEVMEKSLRDAQGAGWEAFNTFKDDEFWYGFLEQTVQTYSRLVDDGLIIDPPKSVLAAMIRINDLQEGYEYPDRDDLKEAKKNGETERLMSLKRYREEKAYEFIQKTEEEAKIVLKEMVTTELQFIGDKFVENMTNIEVSPKVTDLGYYLMCNLSQGVKSLDLDKEIVEEAGSLPDEGSEHYTAGGELSTPDGEEYIGYYHVHRDTDDNIIYMAGEFHNAESHDELNPFANKITVPIGDINDYGEGSYTSNPEKPFVLEKYILINGAKVNTKSAITTIKREDPMLNISDVYPGNMELIYPIGQDGLPNKSVAPIGIDGELGVKYGVELSIIIDNKKYFIADAHMSAIDTKIGQIAPLEANSKLLLCLLNKLKQESDFELLYSYIFSMKKVISVLAIYNDLGFLNSIGERTVQTGDARQNIDSSWDEPNFDSKPGVKATFPNGPTANPVYEGDGELNWASYDDRNYGWSLGTKQWDEWDRVLLRNSKSRVKKLFKQAYFSRDYDPNAEKPPNFAGILGRNLKAALKPQLGARILPLSLKGKLIDNPFNSRGELCSREDSD